MRFKVHFILKQKFFSSCEPAISDNHVLLKYSGGSGIDTPTPKERNRKEG
jgi:hypothetical protein